MEWPFSSNPADNTTGGSDPEGIPEISPGSRSASGDNWRQTGSDPEGVAAMPGCDPFGVEILTCESQPRMRCAIRG